MVKGTRRDFLKSIGVAAIASGPLSLLPSCSEIRPNKSDGGHKPNIIIILADDLGYGDIGCYGQQIIRTPNIDRMAAEGMRFTDHYAGSTVCAPSRCCLMTGLHTGHAFIRGNDRIPLRPSDRTMAELLKQAHYSTGIIGKWGLGEPDTTGIPNRKGFDYWFGYLNQRHAHNYYPEYLWQNQERFPLKNIVRPVNPPGGVAIERIEYSHDLFTRRALQFIDENKANLFFLYLAYTIPHANNEANQLGMEVPSLEPYTQMDWPEPQKAHAAMITRMDSDVGRLFKKLKELALDKNTLVIFTSDNGPHKEGGADPEFFNSSGPLRGFKRDLYEGGIRVPMIARWPGMIKAGTNSDHISAFWDFLPTCCELAGIEKPDNIDGISFLPTLLGRKDQQQKHKYLYWEFHEQGKKQAIRMNDWKGVRLNVASNLDAPIELYNLKDDLSEENNVAAKHPEIVERISRYMKTAHADSQNWPLP